MEPVRRVVIRDKQPLVEPEILVPPLNRIALCTVSLALLAQGIAALQVIMGQGSPWDWFDHLSFAAVAFVWWLLGVIVFLQRHAQRTGALFLLSAACGS